MKRFLTILLCTVAVFIAFSVSECYAQKQNKKLPPQMPIAQQVNFLGDTKSKKYHYPSCKRAPKGQQGVAIDSPMSAQRSGFKPCKVCKPPKVK